MKLETKYEPEEVGDFYCRYYFLWENGQRLMK